MLQSRWEEGSFREAGMGQSDTHRDNETDPSFVSCVHKVSARWLCKCKCEKQNNEASESWQGRRSNDIKEGKTLGLLKGQDLVYPEVEFNQH